MSLASTLGISSRTVAVGRVYRSTVALAFALAAACAAPQGRSTRSSVVAKSVKSAHGKSTLYKRLGGVAAIDAVVGNMLERCAQDERIADRFFNTDLPRLRKQLTDQICAATGGPCRYTGMDMRTTHAGMGITHDEFAALVEDLKAALDQFHVGAAEQAELIQALGGMHDDVVGL